MPIPQSILQFFGHLFSFNPSAYDFAAKKVMYDEDQDEDEDEEQSFSQNSGLSLTRCKKIQSIFQIMYYVHHNGHKRTPLHIMNAESVHSLGHGGKMMTQILNRLGMAISYPELRRYLHDLASFTALHNRVYVGIPSHFDPAQFTSGAIDNWDHEGANTSEHDTVCVLYQD